MCKTLSSWRRCLFQLVSLAFRVGCPIMVGGAVADLTATTEPDVKVFLIGRGIIVMVAIPVADFEKVFCHET